MSKKIVSMIVRVAFLGMLQLLVLNAEAQITLRVPSGFPTIQEAINAAANGDTVLVASGTYVENISFLGKAIIVRSEGGPTVTVIDGNNLGTVVTFESGEAAMSVLEGFTLRNGNASFGAGMTMSGSSPTIVGNIFDTNTQGAGGFGAGIGGNSASPIVERNIFMNNSCDNQFLSGVVSFVNTSSPRVVNNIFVNNPCREINMTLPEGNSPQFSNNTIVGNRVGVRVDGRVNTTLQLYRNNIIVGNEIGLEVDFGSEANNPTRKNNLVFNNVTNFVGISDQTGINGNISAEPLFLDLANSDFHLHPDSPAIDTGDNTEPGLPEKDFDGDPRITDGDGDGLAVVDMGVYEFTTSISAIPFATFDTRLQLFTNHPGKDRFFAKGSFTLGDASNGIDPLTEKLVFSLADTDGTFFEQTLPPGSFQHIGDRSFLFRAPKGSSGIRLMILKPTKDARQFIFRVFGKKLDLSEADNAPVTVSLQIGDDSGAEMISCQNLSNVSTCR